MKAGLSYGISHDKREHLSGNPSYQPTYSLNATTSTTSARGSCTMFTLVTPGFAWVSIAALSNRVWSSERARAANCERNFVRASLIGVSFASDQMIML